MRKTPPGKTAARALGRLARTFAAEIEALNRHRSRGEPAITVQNVSVGDGGKAIVGNVTKRASVTAMLEHGRVALLYYPHLLAALGYGGAFSKGQMSAFGREVKIMMATSGQGEGATFPCPVVVA